MSDVLLGWGFTPFWIEVITYIGTATICCSVGFLLAWVISRISNQRVAGVLSAIIAFPCIAILVFAFPVYMIAAGIIALVAEDEIERRWKSQKSIAEQQANKIIEDAKKREAALENAKTRWESRKEEIEKKWTDKQAEIKASWKLEQDSIVRKNQTEIERSRKECEEQQAEMVSQCERTCKQIKNEYLLVLKEAVDSRQDAPWMATLYSDLMFAYDHRVSQDLLTKNRPALKAAEEVSKLAIEKRALLKQNKMLQYQLDFYEHAFPWLEEFKEIDAQTAYDYARHIDDSDKSEYDRLKNWLSPEEYQKLPTAEKYQRALDRYNKRKKDNWAIGIEFERYIGYELERRGYKVKYQGALLGLEDMGRDLVAEKENETLIIQCKRWAKEKTIHEKHIFQLYGSVVLLSTKTQKQNYVGCFVATTTLSDTAKQCAEYLGIKVFENCEFNEYPMIKCNVSKSGEKIYHLPFDQQYDRVEISAENGDAYVKTVSEAEALGFRRAYRWNPNKSS